MSDYHLAFLTLDDGTLDTLILHIESGETFCFDSEFASQFRNDLGELDADALAEAADLLDVVASKQGEPQ
jgi:hypothetical protein